jgi:exopolyphosphatase
LNNWLRGLSTQGQRPIRAVLGSEASDLDSMASSVAYAWLLARQPGELLTLPVINIPRGDFALRTEAVWLFREAGVQVDDLIFLDEIDLDRAHAQGRLRLVLVDHNSLPASRRDWGRIVEEILDHHADEGLYPDARKIIAPVGSAATLVAERLLQSAPQPPVPAVSTLLLGTILLDTVNLDPAAKRVTPRDEQAAARLLEITGTDRQSLFLRLQAEKFNVSVLSTRDILRKDYKEYRLGAVKCGISSAPLSLGDWIGKDPRIEDSFAQYARSRDLDLLLAMCAYTQPEFRRELAVYTADTALGDSVVALLDSSGLGLSPMEAGARLSGGNLRCYTQADAGGSRKKLQPLLARYLKEETGGAKPAD